MSKMSNETLMKLAEVDFDTVKFEKEGTDGVNVVFTNKAEMQKLEDIALSYYEIGEDTAENRQELLIKFIDVLLDEVGIDDVQV